MGCGEEHVGCVCGEFAFEDGPAQSGQNGDKEHGCVEDVDGAGYDGVVVGLGKGLVDGDHGVRHAESDDVGDGGGVPVVFGFNGHYI